MACIQWSELFSEGFHIIHDDSQPVEDQKELFDLFMNQEQERVEVGYDRRKFHLPLKLNTLTFASSEKYPQLQVADIIAGAVNHWAQHLACGVCTEPFYMVLEKLNLRKYITDCIWPTQNVTPKSLGTEYTGGLHPVNHMADFIRKAKKHRSE